MNQNKERSTMLNGNNQRTTFLGQASQNKDFDYLSLRRTDHKNFV